MIRNRVFLGVLSSLLGACATARQGPAARPLPPGPDRVVAFEDARFAPTMVRFADDTVGVLRSWSDGVLEISWRSPFRVKDLAVAGSSRACVLTTDDEAFCVDEQGHVNGERVRVPGAVSIGINSALQLCTVRADGGVTCTGGMVGAKPDRYAAFPPLRKLIPFTTCAISQADQLICLGDQRTGQYWDEQPHVFLEGVRDASLVPNGPAVTGCILMLNGELQCFGGNSFGEQGVGRRSSSEPLHVVRGLPPLSKLAHVDGVTCGLARDDGSAWCFGAWFGPDYERRAKEIPRCERVTKKVHVPACPESTGDNPCLRMGGSTTPRDVEQTVTVRDAAGQCADGPHEDYVPTPTRLTLLPRALDLSVHLEGVRFLSDDGVLFSTFYGKWTEAVPRPATRGR
ncbi:MAG: hypothetical protein ACOZQL_39095 [Myxococcota bacterium]